MYLDMTTNPLATDSIEKVAIEAIKREAWRELIDAILEWSPTGCSDEDSDDSYQNEVKTYA